jgi:hypothetical protein
LVGIDLEPVTVDIERHHGFLRAQLPHGGVVEGTSRHLLGMLHGLMFWDISQSHPGSPVIHGATVRIGERRLVVMADKGVGKTTLMLGLLAAGHQVEGDEHVVLEPEAAIARPRTLRVKSSSLRLASDCAEQIRSKPSIEQWDGSRIYALSPSFYGRPWTISRGAIDGLVFLEPNHGGRSVAKPISRDEAFSRLMQTVFFPRLSPLAEAVRVRALAAATPAYVLRLGDLTGAEFHLRHVALA